MFLYIKNIYFEEYIIWESLFEEEMEISNILNQTCVIPDIFDQLINIQWNLDQQFWKLW